MIIDVIFDEAALLRHVTASMAEAQRDGLDARSAFWVIRRDVWLEMVLASDFMPHVKSSSHESCPNMLMGLPVRLTVHDVAEAPMIQLVMTPSSPSL